ncbi:MAG: tyrosine-type recombinase/integrase [Thermoguttaceae bacterium]|nr:tyrosine-type recombinase/integrase [Thermoguttaceae bacterium]
MKRYYIIKAKKRTGETRGRRPVIAYRIPIKTRGSRPFVIELRAGKYTENDAQQCAAIIAAIEEAYNGGANVDARTLEFLDMFPDVKKRLAEKGFITLVKEKTLVDLWGEYEAANVDDWKTGTFENKRRSKKRLFQYFNPETAVSTLTKKDAQGFRTWLDDQINAGALAEATASGFIRDVKAVFNWAIKNDVISFNPFQYIRKGTTANPARQFYLELAPFQKLLDACPSQEWQALLILARLEGLRVPSETNLLKWVDVDFKNGALTVHSPKTERYKNKDKRTPPLFLDVAEALEKLRKEQEQSGEKSPFVLPSARGENINLRTRFEKIILRAGLEKWPKLFQNLRLSASNDVKREYGVECEADWIGHSPETAKKHYLIVMPAETAAAKNWSRLKDIKR